jgi:hypothetical protein
MSVIKKMRKQKAVYWAKTGTDEFGAITFAEPVEIKCRWEEKTGQMMNKQGALVTGMDTVYVDREMNIGDKLKKGPLDTNSPPDPKEDREAFEIQGWENLPNFKAKEFLYTAYL